jgi:hypothetical protein
MRFRLGVTESSNDYTEREPLMLELVIAAFAV